jgi:hypothetical protein
MVYPSAFACQEKSCFRDYDGRLDFVEVEWYTIAWVFIVNSGLPELLAGNPEGLRSEAA